ncbi:MAG: putative aminohydrolase SsnA [Chloroflexi bacterium]|nr:putative aminohydrolase SsnA [Chloroflexota bacterium]
MLLIHNGTVLPMTFPLSVIPNGAVLIDDKLIVAIGSAKEIERKYADQITKRIDATGRFILPGNICAHTHFYGAFARGMAIPGAPAKNFVEVLKKLWWKLDRALDDDGVKYSALVSMVDAIKNGTTTLIDHHASPNVIKGSLNAIADAATQTGLRTALCYEVTDRNGLADAQQGIAENVACAERVHGRTGLAAAMGVHASFTVSDKTLRTCVAEAERLSIPLHIHVAEDAADQAHCLKKHGMRVVQRLDALGALNKRSMLAHCIHIDDAEMQLIAKRGAKVMHQPRSNMNNGVGVAPIERMLKADITVGLGNDGFSNDAFAEMKACDMLHKLNAGDPRAMGADKIVGMVYSHNRTIAQMFWPDLKIGALEAGARADVILMDYTPFTPLTAGNLPWHMLFGMSGGMVTHTISAGVVLMADRKLLFLDEAAIAVEAEQSAKRAWKRVADMAA